MGEILKYSSFLVTQCHGFWISIIVRIGDTVFGRIQATALIYAKKVFFALEHAKALQLFQIEEKSPTEMFWTFRDLL